MSTLREAKGTSAGRRTDSDEFVLMVRPFINIPCSIQFAGANSLCIFHTWIAPRFRSSGPSRAARCLWQGANRPSKIGSSPRLKVKVTTQPQRSILMEFIEAQEFAEQDRNWLVFKLANVT